MLDTRQAMHLIYAVLIIPPSVAVLGAIGWAWYTASALKEPVSDYATNHPHRKGY